MLILLNLDLLLLSINESLKVMGISIDECKERTARLRAKKDSFIKACSSSFHENNDKDLKVIDASPIRSLFFNMNLDNHGTDDESTLPRRRPKNSESLDLDAKFGKSEIGEVTTSNNIEPTILNLLSSNNNEIGDLCFAI